MDYAEGSLNRKGLLGMRKLSKAEKAVLLDMIAPMPKNRYFRDRGNAPRKSLVFKICSQRGTMLFTRTRSFLFTGTVRTELPSARPTGADVWPEWYAGFWYIADAAEADNGRNTGSSSSAKGSKRR